MTSMIARFAGVLAALAAALLLSSCTSQKSDGPTDHQQPTDQPVVVGEPAGYNSDDVEFATNMIPHHQQAVDMAAMVPTRTASQDMLVIARDISTDQQAEIRALQGMLNRWGEPAAPGMAPMSMQGMVDQATLDRLMSLKGTDFDTLWMRSMISHHQGAIIMSQDEIAHGENHDAIEMAKRIVTAQQREIAYLTHLLSPTE